MVCQSFSLDKLWWYWESKSSVKNIKKENMQVPGYWKSSSKHGPDAGSLVEWLLMVTQLNWKNAPNFPLLKRTRAAINSQQSLNRESFRLTIYLDEVCSESRTESEWESDWPGCYSPSLHKKSDVTSRCDPGCEGNAPSCFLSLISIQLPQSAHSWSESTAVNPEGCWNSVKTRKDSRYYIMGPLQSSK